MEFRVFYVLSGYQPVLSPVSSCSAYCMVSLMEGIRDYRSTAYLMTGFFGGALVALPPSIFPVLCPDPGTLGSRMGLSWTTSALSILIGTPVAGAVIDLQTVNFLGVQAWSGATLIVGMVLLLALWVMLSRSQKRILV